MTAAELIKNRYDRCAKIYDSDSGIQKRLAGVLAQRVFSDGIDFNKVLDVGCGTGHLAQEMGRMASAAAHFYMCDVSFNMLRRAEDKQQSSRYCYIQADASNLPFSDFTFELIVSNAAYQWVKDTKKAFIQARRALKPKGRFYFTIFNNNTLWQLQEVCKASKITMPAASGFVSKAELFDFLKEAGFDSIKIETFSYEKYYKDLWELLRALKRTGAAISKAAPAQGLPWRSILRKADGLYRFRFGGENGIPATYEAYLITANAK